MRTLLYVVALMHCVGSYAQIVPVDKESGKVLFQQIVELDSSYKAAAILSTTKEWFSVELKTFNRSNSDKNFKTGDMLGGTQRGNSTQVDQLHKVEQPLKLFEPSENKVLGSGVLKYSGSSMGCLRVIYVNYAIRVMAKDGKYKIDVSNFTYTHYNQMSMKESQLYGFKDEGPCSSKNSLEELLKCEKCDKDLGKFYTYLNEDINTLMVSLKTFIQARPSRLTYTMQRRVESVYKAM